MLPIALSLAGRGLDLRTVGFLSWFGPRGRASILFAVLVIEEVALPVTPRLLDVVSVTVLLSIYGHGRTLGRRSRLRALANLGPVNNPG